MLHFRLISTLLLAATCLLTASGSTNSNNCLIVAPLSTHRVITCDDTNNVQRLRCEEGLIGVESALYGRSDSETCGEGKSVNELSNTQCSEDGTVDILKTRCDGQKVCEYKIGEVRPNDPCTGTYKYLNTTFSCFPVVNTVACENSLAILQCDQGKVIFVYNADFGRTDQTTCSYQRSAGDVQNVMCSGPTTKVADSCNGKNSCSIKASHTVFGDTCSSTYKYLEVNYRCQYPAITAP
ncbi:L-rhamnose-binding lectin SML-like [Seriola aureovittata]|uniref:L-rhamnose-binding lectin SML-like n=1 Tax=Seriola aureovittata TaxID=2871759 RepID=UPI0024BE60A8|nr:L-rhamnose-binding lectin SML-like isoform X2 [Seriola aureovittata]XP_056241284.1 L-rhamnose-binding lectin SML-like [Seriola aureovittata]